MLSNPFCCNLVKFNSCATYNNSDDDDSKYDSIIITFLVLIDDVFLGYDSVICLDVRNTNYM